LTCSWSETESFLFDPVSFVPCTLVRHASLPASLPRFLATLLSGLAWLAWFCLFFVNINENIDPALFTGYL